MSRPKVAYVMSRFPKLSETFVLFELLAVEAAGVDVVVYPLLREKADVVHPEAVAVARRARYQPFVAPVFVASHAWFLRHRPGAYLGALAGLLRATWRSPNFFVGAMGIFPKVVHMARLMEREGVTHVHCHFANHPAAAGMTIRRLTGIPFSFTAHGSDLHKDRTGLADKVSAASFVLTISEYNRQLIVDTCRGTGADKVSVLHCGVDTSVFAPHERPDVAARPFVLACVGTLHEVKGQAYLVDAVAALAAEGVDVRCELVGDGPDREALRLRADRAGVGDRVVLHGGLTRDGVARVLVGADVLVAPSVPTASGKREGIPVVLMEAMASGLPVVASRLSGIPELVDDGVSGLLVEPKDVAGIAAAIRRLRDDAELRTRLARAARATVERGFDVRANAELLAERFRASAAVERRAA